jgi:hypothetical protein
MVAVSLLAVADFLVLCLLCLRARGCLIDNFFWLGWGHEMDNHGPLEGNKKLTIKASRSQRVLSPGRRSSANLCVSPYPVECPRSARASHMHVIGTEPQREAMHLVPQSPDPMVPDAVLVRPPLPRLDMGPNAGKVRKGGPGVGFGAAALMGSLRKQRALEESYSSVFVAGPSSTGARRARGLHGQSGPSLEHYIPTP